MIRNDKRLKSQHNHSTAIIITTRNRLDDLTTTLETLLEMGLARLPIYIIDDASETAIASLPVLAAFEALTLIRNDEARGLIVNRNTLARIAKEDILISLDDDSCFASPPDLKALSSYFVEHPRVCAVEFDNIDPPAECGTAVPNGACVQMYTGFGHAIDRHKFLSLGGYRDFFFHMCEERDFGQRAWTAGFEVHKYRAITVLHRKTPVARLHDRNLYFLARNTVFMRVSRQGIFGALLLAPMIAWMASFWKAGRGRRMVALRGALSGVRLVIRKRKFLAPMPAPKARAFAALPQR